MTRYGMSIDLERCLGCYACVVACATENELAPDAYRVRMREDVTGRFPDLTGEFRPESCYHCDDAPCVAVCPTGATRVNAEGIVTLEPARCIGCKACITACPYGMRYLTVRGVADKCTFCAHRVADGRVPACVETCPTGARAFGDLDDPASPVRVAIAGAGKSGTAPSRAGAHPKLVYLNSRFVGTSDGGGHRA